MSDNKTASEAVDADILRDPIHLLAFGFGSGLSPKAPGTVGSVLAVVLYLLLFTQLSALLTGLVLLVGFIAGVVICGRSAEKLGVHDHGGIVWDEFIGQWLVLAFAPLNWWGVLWSFALFRLFDIVKPWPIRVADKNVGGGFGIMIDDVLAAAYAIVVLLLIQQAVALL